MNCNGCGCVANYDDDTEFCGRLVLSGGRDSRGRRSTSVIGCDWKTCPQCKNCNFPKVASYSRFNNKNNNKKNNNNKNNNKNNTAEPKKRPQNVVNNKCADNQIVDPETGRCAWKPKPVTRRALLKTLRRQQQMNREQGIVSDRVTRRRQQINREEDVVPDGVIGNNNNADANFNEDLNLSNNVRRDRMDRRVVEQERNMNSIQSNNVEEEPEEIVCTQFSKEKCNSDLGCEWDNENVICKSLEVVFYSQEGESGSYFRLPVGNYDGNEISSFEFKPEFMTIPLGLRVKIWNKSGYVGPVSGFLGNNNPDMANVKKNLYPITELGSLQICNMKTCVKPSQYQDMQLISVIDGNNIDFVEDNVKDLGSYKERLREKIHRKLLDVRFTHKDCLEQVAKHLQKRNIDISSDLSEIENAFLLQKVFYELDNIPDCRKLLESNSNNLNETEILTPIESLLSRNISPSPSVSLNNTSVESIEEESNVHSIIFIFVFLLIILLIAALIYIYMMHQKPV